MSTPFTSRAYGCAIIKSINSNYNADFSHQPRTLPDGKVYATDKALKYTVKHYLKAASDENKVLYFKRLNKDFNPFDLVEGYREMFKTEVKSDSRDAILQNLLSCIDIRCFGATFAPKGAGVDKKNISIHGPVQITHGVNRFPKNEIFSEQIMSPFRNPGEEGAAEKGASTLGTQSKLREGHYVHHFSVNPRNLEEHLARLNGNGTALSEEDMAKLKEALRRGATYYDSASKAGTENELLLWGKMKQGSKVVLPAFVELVQIAEDGTIDLGKVTEVLDSEFIRPEVEAVELYCNPGTKVVVQPGQAVVAHL
ncbi:hypothetical protein BH24BAC1_BH24BAC1_35300 [soil metagenome]